MGWLRTSTKGQRCRAGDRLEPADRRRRRMAAAMVRALARPDLSESRQAGRAALALHARGRLDRLGRRSRHARDRRHAAAGAVLHVHPGAAHRQPLPARHRLHRAADGPARAAALASCCTAISAPAGRMRATRSSLRHWIELAQGRWKPNGGQRAEDDSRSASTWRKAARTRPCLRRSTAPGSRELIKHGDRHDNGPAVAGLVVRAHARPCADQHRPDRRLGRLGARSSRGAGHAGRAGDLLAGLERAHQGRAAHLRQQAIGAVVGVARGARPDARATASRCRRIAASRRSSPRRPGRCAATRS